MSNLKKRVLVIVSGLALALIMGAVSDAANINRSSTDDSATTTSNSLPKIAGHEHGHGGG
ncbi:MAG: hypothetical protein AAF702_40635 [Chloroflexota bacterium]